MQYQYLIKYNNFVTLQKAMQSYSHEYQKIYFIFLDICKVICAVKP